MRAAVLEAVGQTPTVRDFPAPDDAPDGADLVDVTLAGCNPVDLALAAGQMGEQKVPKVVGKEGVGIAADGSRVYFDSPPAPFGSWAQRVRVDPTKTYPVPDGLDDDLAVACGIAGLAAWLPLTRHTTVTPESRVLILGATGVVGKIAVQAAKILGAGHVVGAGRNADELAKARDLGADAIVTLGDDDAKELKKEAGDGYDIVIDLVYGDPFLAALEATAIGGTLVTIGQGAGGAPEIPFLALAGRTHVGHLNDHLPPDVVRAAYAELTALAGQGRIVVETTRYPLEDAVDAWQAQADGPHIKIGVAVR